MTAKSKVRTCLWFNAGGEAAAEFYVTLLPDSRIETVVRPDPPSSSNSRSRARPT